MEDCLKKEELDLASNLTHAPSTNKIVNGINFTSFLKYLLRY